MARAPSLAEQPLHQFAGLRCAQQLLLGFLVSQDAAQGHLVLCAELAAELLEQSAAVRVGADFFHMLHAFPVFIRGAAPCGIAACSGRAGAALV